MNPSIATILLAAGSSSRMGQSKQLLSVEGQPLLLKAAMAALDTHSKNIIVVLGAHEEAHRKTIDHLPLEIILNPDWQKGIGTSLKTGLSHALQTNPETEAVVVMVCDQPFISGKHLQNLMLKYKTTGNPIIASSYASTIGVPALFHRSLFQTLLALDDDQGAKKILTANREQVLTVEFPDGGVDLDTMEDYTNYLKSAEN